MYSVYRSSFNPHLRMLSVNWAYLRRIFVSSSVDPYSRQNLIALLEFYILLLKFGYLLLFHGNQSTSLFVLNIYHEIPSVGVGPWALRDSLEFWQLPPRIAPILFSNMYMSILTNRVLRSLTCPHAKNVAFMWVFLILAMVKRLVCRLKSSTLRECEFWWPVGPALSDPIYANA